MELSIKTTVLFLSILGTGLTAGLCFTWSNAVTTGLSRLDDLTFLQSFQSMNRAILNPSFFIVFFGPVLLLFINMYLHRQSSPRIIWSFALATILFLFGVAIVTITKNVPLNEMLDANVLANLNTTELQDLRTTFEKPWSSWHMIRTICSFTSFALLLSGILFTNN